MYIIELHSNNLLEEHSDKAPLSTDGETEA